MAVLLKYYLIIKYANNYSKTLQSVWSSALPVNAVNTVTIYVASRSVNNSETSNDKYLCQPLSVFRLVCMIFAVNAS
jgi:hypothetical protein